MFGIDNSVHISYMNITSHAPELDASNLHKDDEQIFIETVVQKYKAIIIEDNIKENRRIIIDLKLLTMEISRQSDSLAAAIVDEIADWPSYLDGENKQIMVSELNKLSRYIEG